LWNELLKNSKRPYYIKKLDILEKMQQKDADIYNLIIEMSSF
jgi:hypothetical protein